jgi:two-component system phosphate regulon sensor histidine kinase PhoR
VSRLQLRLAGVLSALVTAVVLVSGILAERGIERRERTRIESSLRERARLVRDQLGALPIRPEGSVELQALALRTASSAAARVTFIAPDGTVVGESDVPLAELPRIENHAGRPEVAAALAGREGSVARHSATVHRSLLYLALPAEGGGVVRLAADLSSVQAAVAELRRTLVAAGAVGWAASLGLAFVLSSVALRPLRELADAVGAIASGQLERRAPLDARDEMGRIAASINFMAEQLRRQLEDATAEKERIAAVLAGMTEGVLVLDAEGRVLLANPRFRNLFGTHGPVEGRIPLEVIRDAEVDEVLREVSGAEPVVRDLEGVGPRDLTLQMHAAVFPARGKRLGTVIVFHDVTEVRRLESMRRDFVANVSHELKTPLTAIRGYAETLASGGVPPDRTRSFLEVILRHAERLGSLIDDLLQLSRIESRKLELHPVELDVVEAARALLRDLAPRLAERGHRAEVVDDGAAAARADQRALEQVLMNLLDNAIKYTDPQGRITVSVRASPARVWVAVSDTGIGIPSADLPRVFERFYRVDKARSRELGGTGLGLSIVKHLVQSLGGEVHIESEPGRGTRVSFSLPRAAA